MKDRMLTVLVPIKDGDATVVATLPAIDTDNINVIYKHEGMYKRLWLNPTTNQYEYHEVVDREFPYLGKPLEIFDFTYDATRMGTAPTISAQGVMWYADKDENGNDVTLENLWLARCNDCHVSFNGENFYLKQVPTSSKSNEDARYKYDIDFVSERVVLERVYLYDVVQPFIAEKPISESAQFSFFGDINELAKRINASLLRSGLLSLERKTTYYNTSHYSHSGSPVEVPYLTYEQWGQMGIYPAKLVTDRVFEGEDELLCFGSDIYDTLGGDYNRYLMLYIYENTDGEYNMSGYKCVIGKDKKGALTTSEEKLITFDNNTIHEALQQFHDTFELQHYIYSEKDANGAFTGNTIIMIADCEHDFADVNGDDFVRDDDGIPTTASPFDYGVDNELLSKEKTNTTDKIITRITGVGSEENIPWYYPNPTADGWIKPMYKTNGVEQDVEIDYPTSEVPESVRYEKYLKNRIGDVFQYGIVKIIKYAATSYAPSTALSSPYHFEVGYVFNVDFDGAVYTSDVSCTICDNITASMKKDGADYTPGFDLINGHGSLERGQYVVYFGWTDVNPVFSPQIDVYFFYQGLSWWETGFSPIPNLKHHYKRVGRDDYEEWWFTGNDPSVNHVNLIVPELNKKYYSYNSNDPSNGLADEHYWTNRNNAGHIVTYAVPATTQYIASTYLRGAIKIIHADGWYKNSKKVDLGDYGIVDDQEWNPDVFDTIEFQRMKYVTPQPNLMPEVYIKTDGERRFYNAVNYPLASGTPDTMIGEQESEGQIINPLYYKEGSTTHFDFENEYIQSRPHEHIENFDDVKPSIKGQTWYFHVSVRPEDWAATYRNYYRKNIDGNYVANRSPIWSDTTIYESGRIDVVEEFAYDELDNDEVWESNDDGNVSGEYKHPYFFAKLRPLGFNLFDLALQDDMVLSMTTGHCGACNFKIGVDENTKKNPVQIWEYDVYEGANYATKTFKYAAGALRRVVDTSNLYYDKTPGDSSGYVLVDAASNRRLGFLVADSDISLSRSAMFERRTYSAQEVVNGEVGALKKDNKNHFAGDVVTNGKLIASQQDTSENYVWVALMKDTDTYGVLMPSARPDYADGNFNVYIRPKSVADTSDEDTADKFVLTNIRMPQVYLRRAEKELSKRLIAYMYDNNYQKFNFSIKFSRIFLAQNPSIDADLNENSVLYVSFNNRTYRQYVKHYTYRMAKDAALPEISVDMNEELSVSRTQVERESIARLRNETSSVRRLQAAISRTESRIGRQTIGRNEDVIVNGNLVSRGAVTSFGELQDARRITEINLSDTKIDLEVNHFKKGDFEILNGTDLKIGDSLFLPTVYKDGDSIKKRKWDESTSSFVVDGDETYNIEGTGAYRNIVGAFDQIDIANGCAFVSINGISYPVTYSLPRERENPESSKPELCPAGNGNLWFRINTTL